MKNGRIHILFALALLIVAALFAGALVRVVSYTPNEVTMGLIQRIFYLHLPVAINTFLACLVVCIASIGYLWTRRSVWDDLASSAAKVAVLLCSIVLLTGMFWARGAWGVWWTWSTRLTFSLMLWLLYVVYLIVRNSIDSRQRRAMIAAVYGLIAFLDVPLVYLSARLIPDYIHPPSIELASEMKWTLAIWFVPVTLGTALLIAMRFHLARRESADRDARTAGTAEAPAVHPVQGGGSPWDRLVLSKEERPQ